MKINIRRIGATIGALTVLGLAGGVSATTASASATASITATTSVTNHPDTTSVSGPACTSSPGGPVWAKDNFTATITAEPTGTSTWQVTFNDSGTFTGFADPTTCAALGSYGTLTGQYTLAVTSPTAPVAADLKAKYDGAVSTSTMVADFFGGAATKITGGDYFFSYQGGNYVQTTSGSTGDVVASSAPSPSPSPSGSPSPSSSPVVPKGAVQTGPGAPGTNPLVPAGAGVVGLGVLIGAGAFLRRRSTSARG